MADGTNEPRFNDDGKLNERRHKIDHYELGQMLEDRKNRKILIKAIKDKIITTGVVFAMVSIGGIFLIGFKEQIVEWLK